MMRWYFIRCQSGREDSIARNTMARLKTAGVADLVPQVLVPFEKVTDLKNGKKRTVNKKLYPGYLMVQADIEDAEDARTLKAPLDLGTAVGAGGIRNGRGRAIEPLRHGAHSGHQPILVDAEVGAQRGGGSIGGEDQQHVDRLGVRLRRRNADAEHAT